MEKPESPKPEIVRAGRPRGVTSKDIAARAGRIRKHLKNGLHRKEICAREGLTLAEYRSAMRWIGNFGSDNTEVFADFLVAQQGSLEELHSLIELELASGQPDLNAYARLKKLSLDIHTGILDMALKLGILQREAIKIESRNVTVCFGDEEVIPWFAVEEPDRAS